MCDFGLRARISGFTTLFSEPEESEHWFEDDHDRAAMEAAARLLANPEPFGVVAENDYIARAMLDTAERMQRKPGKDFFLCGFDDLPLAESRNLSSIRQPRYELGYEAARLLGDIIAGREVGTVNKILPVTLIPRGSSDVANAHIGAASTHVKYVSTPIEKGLNV
jgi:LacI family transcriptional regulator